jgi:hypothetical protein
MAYPLLTVDANPESSPEAPTPNRPATVPETGVWDAELGKWEVARKDEHGARDGERLLYRDDGTLFARARFVAGVQDGPFVVYHRDGKVAREGHYVSGKLDGTVTAYAPESPDGERIRACCVPAGAARLCERFRAGEFLLETFYDREGRALLSDGRLCPARPDGLPELAQYDESRGGWVLRNRGQDRSWSEDGKLTEEVDHKGDGARVVRTFDATGRLRQECGFTAPPMTGRTGRSTVAFPTGAEPLRRRAHPRGTRRVRRWPAHRRWTFMDADGQILRTADRGAAFRGDDEARMLAGIAVDSDWPSQARALAADGRLRQAFVVAARGAVATGDRAALERFRAEHVVPLTADREAQWGEALAQSTDTTVAAVLDALVGGADAAAAFRALASVLPGSHAAASDLVEASLLLAPERRMTHLTRALLRFQRGDREGALADADVIASESQEAAESLRSYAAVVFRGFDGWPGQETFAPDPELTGVPLDLAHSVERSVTWPVSTPPGSGARGPRFGRWSPTARRRGCRPTRRRCCRAVRLPCGATRSNASPMSRGPATAPWAARTPRPRRSRSTRSLRPTARAYRSCSRSQHADWAALSWLCWAVGLDRVGLPNTVTARGELAPAMKMVVRRTWRIRDRLARAA